METLNSILDTLIIYTEAMYIYVLFGCLILHINKYLDRHEYRASAAPGLLPRAKVHLALAPAVNELGAQHSTESTLDCGGQDATVLGASRHEASERNMFNHNVVSFHRGSGRSYWSTMTCKQLRSYLKDLGYTRLNKLRKPDLIDLCHGAS